MNIFINNLWNSIRIAFESFYNYLKSSPTSKVFFLFFVIVAILNVVREIFIWQEKKCLASNQRCKYLIIDKNGQDCSLSSYRQGFKDRANGCEGCAGKTFSITNEDAMERAANGATWKHVMILMANYSRSILPYASFLYTLAIVIFEK